MPKWFQKITPIALDGTTIANDVGVRKKTDRVIAQGDESLSTVLHHAVELGDAGSEIGDGRLGEGDLLARAVRRHDRRPDSKVLFDGLQANESVNLILNSYRDLNRSFVK